MGQSVDDAKATLVDRGLKAVVEGSGSTVISQDPGEGSRVGRDSTVTLETSDDVTLPNVVGQSYEDASGVLMSLGLNVSRDGDGNMVLSQDPAAGTQVEQGSTVTLSCVTYALDKYSWEELADVSDQIARANNDEAALIIAANYGLCNEDGTLDGTQRKSVILSDGTQTSVEVIGFRHDELADGGEAGITWAFCNTIGNHAYNGEDDVTGGWQASTLRTYCNEDLFETLPDDLQEQVKRVEKYTDNVGIVTDEETAEAAVSATSDRLWPLSAREIYGDIDWWSRNGGDRPFYDTVYNAEGKQYRLFSDEGLNADTDTSSLVRLGGTDSEWWLRSPNPYEDRAEDVDFWGRALFIDHDGKKNGDGKCSDAKGVAPCFCI